MTKNKESKFHFSVLRCEKIKNIQKAEDERRKKKDNSPLLELLGFAATNK